MSATALDGFLLSNAAATSAAFKLKGGKYGVTASATFGGGTITLQRLGPDGTTYVTCLTAFNANGYAAVDLPAGTYQIAVATATAAYAEVYRIPN